MKHLPLALVIAAILWPFVTGGDWLPDVLPPRPDGDDEQVIDADPSPFAESGLHVLIIEETGERHSMSLAQLSALNSVKLRQYLDDETGKEGWRRFDQNTDVSLADELWQDAMARPRDSLPWLLVGNGKTGYEGPLPGTLDEIMDLIKKFEQ